MVEQTWGNPDKISTVALGTSAPGLRLGGAALVMWKVLWPLPSYLLVSACCYALGTVGYHLATLDDFEDAARELQSHTQEAWTNLAGMGICFWYPDPIRTRGTALPSIAH